MKPSVCSLRKQTYVRLSLVGGDKRQPDIRLRFQATRCATKVVMCRLSSLSRI